MNTQILLRNAVVLGGVLVLGALGSAGVAVADDPNAVPAALLNTTCSLDQLMAATKAVDPVVYGALVEKYNSEPRWIQGGVVYHMNLLLEKDPAQRQAEVDQIARILPAYAPLFVTTEVTGTAVAAKCAAFPAEDPTVWTMPI